MPPVIFQQIVPGVEYACHPQHRDHNNHNKSQWTISQGEEIQSFTRALAQAWILGSRGWGLHLANGVPDYLGVAADRDRRLFVARFEDGNENQKWHGYPADHQNKVNDRLPEEIKQFWLQNNVLAPAKVRKLVKGERCSL
jgi:hypothetical protein